ncbi:MAG: hypothetical protein RXQ95_07290, partial [Vulcanisaeta sp.]
MPEPKEETQHGNINITQDAQGTEQTRQTEQTHETHNTNLTREFLTYLGIGSAGSTAGGGAEGVAFATPVASPSASGAVGVKVEARGARPTNLQAN